MDSFRVSNIRSQKANAIKKHHQRRKIGNLIRIVEVGLLLVLFLRFTVLLPIAFKNSGEYYRDSLMAVVSPRFVFVIGNIIVIILFVKSDQFSAKHSSKSDIYDEFLKKSERNQGVYCHRAKQGASGEQRIVTGDTYNNALDTKQHRRIQSEKSKSVGCDKSHKELTRTLSEKGHSLEKKSKKNMSNKEFRQTIEAFIARQHRFIREEECSVC